MVTYTGRSIANSVSETGEYFFGGVSETGDTALYTEEVNGMSAVCDMLIGGYITLDEAIACSMVFGGGFAHFAVVSPNMLSFQQTIYNLDIANTTKRLAITEV